MVPMNKYFRAPLRLMIIWAAVLAWPIASFAQVKVIMSGGFSAAFQELLPALDKDHRHTSQHGKRTVAGKRAQYHRRSTSPGRPCRRGDPV